MISFHGTSGAFVEIRATPGAPPRREPELNEPTPAAGFRQRRIQPDSPSSHGRPTCGPYRACALHILCHPWTYCSSADSSTRSRILRFRNFGVTKSTWRPPSNEESSSCIRINSNPGTCPASNSTSTSMSLSGRKSSRRTDPNRASFEM